MILYFELNYVFIILHRSPSFWARHCLFIELCWSEEPQPFRMWPFIELCWSEEQPFRMWPKSFLLQFLCRNCYWSRPQKNE